jgi:hypothetical protein
MGFPDFPFLGYSNLRIYFVKILLSFLLILEESGYPKKQIIILQNLKLL